MTKIKILHSIIAALCLAASFCTCTQKSQADYMIPTPAERFKVVPDSWKLVKRKIEAKGKDEWQLECTHKNKKHSWPVDQFFLADRLDSNSICAGGWEKLTSSYLNALAKIPNDKVVVELVSKEKNGPLKVASIWNFGPIPKYATYFCQLQPMSKDTQAKLLKSSDAQFDLVGER